MTTLEADLRESISWIHENNKRRRAGIAKPLPKPIILVAWQLPTSYEIEAVHAQLEELVSL
jgi:hypothetical protein